MQKQRNLHELRFIVYDGITSQIMLVLTISGVFLSSYAVALGASNTQIGLLAAIPAFAQLIQLPSVYLVAWWKKRKQMILWLAGLSRLFLLFLALTAFLPDRKLAIYLTIFILLLLSPLGSSATCAWNSWMHDLVPQHLLGSFFGKRLSLAALGGVIATVLCGLFLFWWNRQGFPETQAYFFIFLLAFISGFIGLYFIYRIPDRTMRSQKISWALLFKPFAHSNFNLLLVFYMLSNIAFYLAVPFFSVFILRDLNLPVSSLVFFSIVSQIVSISAISLLGKKADLYSHKAVMALIMPLYVFILILWVWLGYFRFLLIPVLIIIHILFGVVMAGYQLALSPMALKLVPKKEAASAITWVTVMNSLAGGFMPIFSGKLSEYIGLAGVFVLAIPLAIFANYSLLKVNEDGYRGRRELLRSFLPN